MNSIVNSLGVSFLLENFLHDFVVSNLLRSIVPFYDLSSKLLPSKCLNFLSQNLIFYTGSSRTTDLFVVLCNIDHHTMEVFNISGVYTGFSIGGLMAKGIGSYFNASSVAFESLNFYHSGFDAAMSRFFYEKRIFNKWISNDKCLLPYHNYLHKLKQIHHQILNCLCGKV